MKKKYTLKISRIVLIVLLLFNFSLVYSQTLITYQGFDNKTEDVWNYTATLNTGTIQKVTSTYISAPNALRLGGSSSSSPDDPFITLNNISISDHTNVYVNIFFSSNGTPDDNDDLFLDISYDNGATYPTSIKLIDGKNSTTSDIYAFNHNASIGITVGSPYTFSVPNGNTQIRVRIRFNELNGQNNTADYYFIDNNTTCLSTWHRNKSSQSYLELLSGKS